MASTINSVVINAASAGIVFLGVVAIVGLLVFLVAKELSSDREESRLKLLSRLLDVAILPLLIVFAFILFIRLEAL